MRLPHRSIKSIQPLPSIHTAFPASHNNTHSSVDSGINSETCLIRQVEDGIEVLPFERCNNLSAPILSPDQEEKEVFVVSQKEMDSTEKPLPLLPASIWLRMSIRQRILALLCIQFLILMTIGLALMAAKNRASYSDQASSARIAGDDPSSSNSTTKEIQRGIFSVPIQLPQQQSSECLSKMNESVAWQCASDTIFQMDVLPSPAGGEATTMITIGAPLNNGTLVHGHQVPDVQPTKLVALTTLSDGPAYHFRTTYDRIVLLRENDLSSAERLRTQPVMRHPTFGAGESLWRCVFNETLIEGYIYVDQFTTLATNTGSTNANASATSVVPKIPYVVKIIENTFLNGSAPYCEKMTVQSDGSLSSRSERLLLSLTEHAANMRAEVMVLETSRRRQQAGSSRDCRCQWLVQ